MSKFNSIEYDESLGTVKIGAGLVWGEVYLALAPHGVKVVGGRGPPVGMGFFSPDRELHLIKPLIGVAGFLLGGGYSYFTDQYGLAIDNIVSHDLVLPNGTFVEVNEQTSPDLFFALKVGVRTKRCDGFESDVL
jgi:FAD/FMN-containing dehydrogenase